MGRPRCALTRGLQLVVGYVASRNEDLADWAMATFTFEPVNRVNPVKLVNPGVGVCAPGTSVEFPIDEELLAGIINAAAHADYDVPALKGQALDHGTAVPLVLSRS